MPYDKAYNPYFGDYKLLFYKEDCMNIVLSGPSGAGKGTLMEKFLSDFPDAKKSVSYTTRKPRTKEVNGVHYYFVTKEEFEKLIEKDFFFEYTTYDNNYYGVPMQNIYSIDSVTVFDLVASSGIKIKKIFPNTRLIYVLPPNYEILKERRKNRGDDRINYDICELGIARRHYDSLLINSQLDVAYLNLLGIIRDSNGNMDEENKKFLDGFFSNCNAQFKEKEKILISPNGSKNREVLNA
jgi:guanylate kinase